VRILDIFKPKEKDTPEKIVEIAVFSLGSESDLYMLSGHLSAEFGNPAWERFAGRRSLLYILDDGLVAEEIPYKLTARLFEDGGGFVRLDLNLASHKFDLEQGILWHRREFSSALTRFLEAALATSDPESLKHTAGTDETLRQLGIEPERIAGELDFGFSPGSKLVKIGYIPKDGRMLKLSKQAVIRNGIFYISAGDKSTLSELERWCYREGASSWHLYSLRRWLERINEVRSSISKTLPGDFARFLRRVTRFILRERRFFSRLLDTSEIEPFSEFNLLASDFDSTSRRLSEIFSARQEEVVTKTLDALKKLSAKQEILFAAWVVLVGLAGLCFGILELITPGHPWLWIIGSSTLIVLPITAYLIWFLAKRGFRKKGKNLDRHNELSMRMKVLEQSLQNLEDDDEVPEEFREELLTRRRREMNRLKSLLNAEDTQSEESQ